jgi:hypothetical protein
MGSEVIAPATQARFARDEYATSHCAPICSRVASRSDRQPNPIDDTSTGKLMEGVLVAFAFLFERSIDLETYDCSFRTDRVRRKRFCRAPRNRTGLQLLAAN